MEAKAVAKHIRMSSQKVRLVVDLIRGKKVQEARNILLYTRKYAAGIVANVLKSAVANAAQNPNIDENVLRALPGTDALGRTEAQRHISPDRRPELSRSGDPAHQADRRRIGVLRGVLYRRDRSG